MSTYFDSLQKFQQSGGLKSATITAQQLLPAIVTHMQRMDRKFTLQVNGRLPKSMDALLAETFELSHLQQPFYTQHCATRSTSYMNVSKNRVKINFTMRYRMTREEQTWVVDEIKAILHRLNVADKAPLEQVVIIHDYIVRNHQYEMQTEGSPFTVYTFMQEKQGVCMAYALLFEKMMELLDIPCYYVVGHANGEGDMGHAWNMVQLDGEWYHIDATWNDLGSKTASHEIRYRYFLRTDTFMEQDHQWDLSHYPPCSSKRFEGLSNVYDAAYSDRKLYFPHPKTAHLTSVSLAQLAFEEEMNIRVQFCTTFEKHLYFSHYGKKGFLYRYSFETKELICLKEQEVTRIVSTVNQMKVHFKEGEAMCFEHEAQPDATEKEEMQQADTTVSLMQYGDSWFGSYKGRAQTVAFTSEAGIQLFVHEPIKQLTVDLLLHTSLHVTITTSKKGTSLTTPATLIIPKSVVSANNLAFSSGVQMAYEEQGDVYKVKIMRTDTILFQ